ncbi:MAG: DEAD/DEAH box helicase [Chloroflexi bacterium]|nr:DEAD/DEAH box helicase [Chloroflexota bacterium]MYJ91433.1 DEAD/DEAH box helicase [Chloroflexota bacterium]
MASEDWPLAFSALGLSDRMLSALTALKFEEPTPIQEQSIPMLMNGHDVVGQAQTGTGKTVAFGLPAVEVCDPDLGECQAIVLTPTRELAQQVGSVLDFFARAAGLEATVLMGGRRLSDDFANLERRPQIVVGTPGRIIDHLERRTLRLNRVRMAVLDEADRMLDIGFYPDMRRILRRCPDDRQTTLFSATIPTPIKSLIHQFMHDPEHVHIAPEVATAEGIYQRYYEVADRDKIRAVEELLPELSGRTLVFCNMKVTVDRLVRRLLDRGLNADAIHGDRDQRKRDRVMGQFRSGDLQFLIATDVAARGLDIPDVQHVVNFDLPQTAEDYVHRVGRTGRAGAEGSAISFVGEWDFDQLEKILKLVGDDLRRGELELYSSG